MACPHACSLGREDDAATRHPRAGVACDLGALAVDRRLGERVRVIAFAQIIWVGVSPREWVERICVLPCSARSSLSKPVAAICRLGNNFYIAV